MGRSLQIQYFDIQDNSNKIITASFKDGSSQTAIITLPVKGTTEELFKISVVVDEMKDSDSFMINTYDEWFKYRIERIKEGDDLAVYLVLLVDENLDTRSRLGNLTIRHKCCPLLIDIMLEQEPTLYSLKAEYESNGIFNSFPDNLYEERVVDISTSGGSKKWYVKEVKQYECYSDSFEEGEGIIDVVPSEWRGVYNEGVVPYDNVFNYRIEGNKLIVRSYGKIDLSKTHMRYYFRICHKDVGNHNKNYNINERGEIEPYETLQLFVFGGGGNRISYKGGETDDFKPQDPITYNYVFKVNEHTEDYDIVIPVNGGTYDMGVVSTRDSKNWPFERSNISVNFLSFNENGQIECTPNNGNTERCEVLTFTQYRHDQPKKTINVNIKQIKQDDSWVFKVNNNTSSFNDELDKGNDIYTISVESTHNNSTVKYSVMKKPNYGWIWYDEGKKEIQYLANYGNAPRNVTFTFTQGDGSPLKPIEIIFTQPNISDREFKYIFHHYEVNTQKSVYDDVTGVESEGETVIEQSQTLDDYDVYGPNELSIVIQKDESKNVATFYYTRKREAPKEETTYTINYICGEESIASPQTANGYVGDTIMASDIIPQQIEGYEYKSVEFLSGGDSMILSEDESENVVNVIYEEKEKEKTYYLYFDIDTLIVGYEGKYYSDIKAKLYSYADDGREQTPIVPLVKTESGDFITEIRTSGYVKDDKGYYCELTIRVTENNLDEVRYGIIKAHNGKTEDAKLNVEQRKNGEIIMTDFDYIVMNYTWTDYKPNDDVVYSRDFDCVMFFDTPEIGQMYRKTAYFGGYKSIKDNNKIYAELAYDQIGSTTTNISRIETQVVYLKELLDDGYLKKIKQSGVNYLTIQLYGNLFGTGNGVYNTPKNKRDVKLTMNMYKGGQMKRDEFNKTMINEGGENRGSVSPQNYVLTSSFKEGGSDYETVRKFNHLGTIDYYITEQNAVFTPYVIPQNTNITEIYLRFTINNCQYHEKNISLTYEFNGNKEEITTDENINVQMMLVSDEVKPITNQIKLYLVQDVDPSIYQMTRNTLPPICKIEEKNLSDTRYEKEIIISWDDSDYIGWDGIIEINKKLVD